MDVLQVPLILFLAGLAVCIVFRPDMAAMSGAAAI